MLPTTGFIALAVATYMLYGFISSLYARIISATCTFEANDGNTGAAVLVGRTKLAPARVQYAAAVR
eukprot:10296863-Ditylum_brightwellii.AAC.1